MKFDPPSVAGVQTLAEPNVERVFKNLALAHQHTNHDGIVNFLLKDGGAVRGRLRGASATTIFLNTGRVSVRNIERKHR